MSMNISELVFLPNFNTWARPVIFTPKQSNPKGSVYEGRGIWHKNTMDVMTQDGVVFSDHKMTLSIRDEEFQIVPFRGDTLDIPADEAHPALGSFEITDVDRDGEGGSELTLREIKKASP
jgi:hypothetical protein